MLKPSVVALSLAITAVAAAPQSPATGQRFTLAGNMLRGYAGLQRNLLEAAELMPEEHYSFKPTSETRPYGQLVAHVALSQFGGCAALKGEANPRASEKEEAPRRKTDLVALLKASTAYCDSALNALTDDAMVQMITVGANQAAKGLFLASTNTHGNEMYGTMAVYLRLKGLVPPTTARQNQQSTPPKKEGDALEVVEQFFDAYRALDVDRLVGLFAADGVFEDPTFRQRQEGQGGIRKAAMDMRATFSNVTIELHSKIVDGETVATEETVAGVLTHGDGTRRNIKVRSASFFRVRNGRIQQLTQYSDVQTFNEQTRAGA
jgi:steroid delta-isomerase-like uncharacterized protein